MDMKSRHDTLAIGLLVLLVATAGCSGILGDGPIEGTASPATVGNDALSQTGYETAKERTYNIEETIEIGNESRQVNVTNHVATYRKNYTNAPPGAFGVLSTPKVEVLGQDVNPLTALDDQTLMKRVVSEVQGIEDAEKTGTSTVTMFGNETEMTTFSGTVTRNGQTVDVTAYLVKAEAGDDFVIAGGVHQAGVEAGEDDVRTLIAGIVHDTE